MSRSSLAKEVTFEVLKAVMPLFEQIDRRFVQIDHRFDQIDARFVQIDQRFDQIDARFERIDQRFLQIDARFVQIDQRFDQIDARFERVDHRFEVIEGKLGAGDIKTSGLGIQMDQMNAKLDMALELVSAIPAQGVTIKEHGRRLNKIETDIHVIKLALSKSPAN